MKFFSSFAALIPGLLIAVLIGAGVGLLLDVGRTVLARHRPGPLPGTALCNALVPFFGLCVLISSIGDAMGPAELVPQFIAEMFGILDDRFAVAMGLSIGTLHACDALNSDPSPTTAADAAGDGS